MSYDVWKKQSPEDAGFYRFDEREEEDDMVSIGDVEFDRAKYVEILERGLCNGVGKADGKMCIEAAISQACGLPFGDDPVCVLPAVRAFNIMLNDAVWSSETARAKGLFRVGIAQLGSAGTVDPVQFAKRVAELTIRELVPALFRVAFVRDTPAHKACLAAADRCESEGTREAVAEAARAAEAEGRVAAAAAGTSTAAMAAAVARARAAAEVAARARAAAEAAARAVATATAVAAAARWEAAAEAARAVAEAARAVARAEAADRFLLLGADICLRVLRELGSAGCELLEAEAA